MDSIFSEILASFPIRNSSEQKAAFREFVLGRFDDAQIETLDAHNNIVIGDPDSAKAVFCAHYDTPRRSLTPNLMLPMHKWLHVLYTLTVMLPLLIIVAMFMYIAYTHDYNMGQRLLLVLAYLVIYFSAFFLLFKGPANRNNANDNTSGTAAVLELAELYKDDSRFAFILFDDEEKGKKGSKSYAAFHPELKADTLFVNFDCVGNGETFVVAASSRELGDKLAASLSGTDSNIVVSEKASMNSDHKNFTRSYGICACKAGKHGILYTPLIHTRKDTVCDENNIHKLISLVSKLAG